MSKGFQIVVCIKQVPDPRYLSKIAIDPVTKTIRRENVPAVINPLDKNALEEALRIRERFGGKVVAISMGPPQAERVCRDALAMGADEAILLCDKALAGSDTLATAYALSLAIKKLGNFDMIFCGNETVDGSTAQVPPQLAEFLEVPHVTRVRKIISVNGSEMIVERTIEYGYMKVKVKLPAVIAVTKDINEPRLPTVSAILKCYKKEIVKWTASDIGASPQYIGLEGSPTKVTDVFSPEVKRRREIFEGTVDEEIEWLIEKLHESGVI